MKILCYSEIIHKNIKILISLFIPLAICYLFIYYAAKIINSLSMKGVTKGRLV